MGALRRLFGLEKSALFDELTGVAHAGWDAGVDYEGGYVDVPVLGPHGAWTSAWSNGVYGVDPGVPLSDYAGRSVNVARIWRTQPNVRKVVSFISRNVASVPLHVYEMVSDDDRQRVRDGRLARLVARPRPRVAPQSFWEGVIADRLLYDRWACLIVPKEDGTEELHRVPPRRFHFEVDGLDEVIALKVYRGPGLDWQDIPLDSVIFGHGYSPSGAGLTPMQTLADILAESAEAVRYRRQVWANGARVPAWVERPLEAPDWEDADRQRFDAEWKSRFTGRNGTDAGGAPLLEDGMILHESKAFSPQDTQDIEGRRLTAIEVAAAFHIAPELVGAREGNFSNVREFRQMLYRDSLGPYISEWEQTLNVQLVPGREEGRNVYIEAHLEAKLRGAFEDQAQYLQTATGAPYMTRAEARARLNLPARPEDEGADRLVVPLNVLVGGLASPTDTAPPPDGAPKVAGRPRLRVKANDVVGQRMRDAYAKEIASFVERQRASVMSALGAKATTVPIEDAWNADRWNSELSEITMRRMHQAAVTRASEAAGALDVEDFDPDVMLGWLAVASRKAAESWNAKTLAELQTAVRASEWKDAVANVFTLAAGGRALYLAATTSTDAGNFGANEVAKRGGFTHKTWHVTSGNPRSSHAAMDGETVAVGETFSNGARWPGDAVLPEEERANCQCEISFSREDG